MTPREPYLRSLMLFTMWSGVFSIGFILGSEVQKARHPVPIQQPVSYSDVNHAELCKMLPGVTVGDTLGTICAGQPGQVLRNKNGKEVEVVTK